ncbi:MAG: DNA/RNA helicase domain-containing protein [Beduini sp.]|uniref:DNA/RNA helicase domain-containing protein n=1 Tax=Beduini sp. TaxID=1922300 RepID=UPI0011C8664F
MIVYQETKEQFLHDVYHDLIEDKIEERVKERLHRKTALNEKDSWMGSMQYMYKVMEDHRIPNDSKIAIEYRIPNSNKRIDFMITGEDEFSRESAVIVELKGWKTLEKIITKDSIVRTKLRGHLVETTHPSYQAWSYVSLMQNYNEDVRKYKINLKPCAYLHNYRLKKEDDLLNSCYKDYIKRAPVFTRGDTEKLAGFIAKYIKRGNVDVLYHIENGKIVPSKSLQDSLLSMLKGNAEFDLIDEQKVVFEKALSLVTNKMNKKQVYIIQGGPGTGKSVLAINLLVSILNMNKNIMYVTKNKAPREVYKKKLVDGKYKKVYIDNLFKGSGSFYDSNCDDFDCLVVDEAHRLNGKSGLFQNLGENQIKEIINAAKVSVFFVDDHQIVTTKDIGSRDEIKKWANLFNAEIHEDILLSQFRCSGSDSYLSWIDNVLQINDEASDDFDYDYDIRILDNPDEVKKLIMEKNKVANKSRMVAGYCWDWVKNGKNNSEFHDIQIGDFGMSWNLGNSSTWAIDKESVNEIGCIHTCQGLEFDYIGIIIGKDLQYDGEKVVTDFFQRAKTDQSIKGLKKLYKENREEALMIAEQIIKNTYRTLLTRGQKGCYIYCVDENLNNYLKARLKYKK